jgi:hypothetical protein
MDSAYNISLVTTYSFSPTTYYIRIYTESTSGIYASNIFLPLTLEVYNCKEQSVDFVDSTDKIIISVAQNSAVPIVLDISGKFKSGHTLCPITSFTIKKVVRKSSGYTMASALRYIKMGTLTNPKNENYFGNLIISKTSSAFTDYLVYITASNGLATSDASIYLVSVSVVAAA